MLRAGDVLVFNDTRVIPAQLEGEVGNARIGATLHKRMDLRRWQAFVRNGRRLKPGSVILFGAGVTASAEECHADGSWTLVFGGDEPVEVLLERAGTMPLPPYIAGKRPTDLRDREDYQTMFAAEDGAVAAPTAALHFTPELMAALADAGIGHETLTLHVGAGTFLPVKAEDTADHAMHAERGRIEPETAARLNAVRASGGRIIAVGTTSLRSLEAVAQLHGGQLAAHTGPVNLVSSPMKLSATPVRNDVAPPLLGQHTEEVLGELLGYSSEKIQQLRKDAII
jgi:S-adenosylmethionine:tRNA ribosyltransferase-isomerase